MQANTPNHTRSVPVVVLLLFFSNLAPGRLREGHKVTEPAISLPVLQADLITSYVIDISHHKSKSHLFAQRRLCQEFNMYADMIGLRKMLPIARSVGELGTNTTIFMRACISNGNFDRCDFQNQPLLGFLLAHTVGRLSADFGLKLGLSEEALLAVLSDWMLRDLYPLPETYAMFHGTIWQIFIRSEIYPALGVRLCDENRTRSWGGAIAWPCRMFLCLHSVGHGALYAIVHRYILHSSAEHRTACYELLPDAHKYPLVGFLDRALSVCDAFPRNHFAFGCATGVFHTARVLNPSPTFACHDGRFYALCLAGQWQIDRQRGEIVGIRPCVTNGIPNLFCIYASVLVRRPTNMIAGITEPFDTQSLCRASAGGVQLSTSNGTHLPIWRVCFAGISFRPKLTFGQTKGFPVIESSLGTFWRRLCSAFHHEQTLPMLTEACLAEMNQAYQPSMYGDYTLFSTEAELLMNG